MGGATVVSVLCGAVSVRGAGLDLLDPCPVFSEDWGLGLGFTLGFASATGLTIFFFLEKCLPIAQG